MVIIKAIGRFFKALGQFLYDFIIGDDKKIAISVAIVMIILVALLLQSVVSDEVLSIIATVLVVAGFSTSLAIDVKLHG